MENNRLHCSEARCTMGGEKGKERSGRGDAMELRYAHSLEGRPPESWQPLEAHLEEGAGV